MLAVPPALLAGVEGNPQALSTLIRAKGTSKTRSGLDCEWVAASDDGQEDLVSANSRSNDVSVLINNSPAP
jgi:hypothetical protein